MISTFVILQCHGVHGSFLQSLQEKLNQIANVFSVGTLESELFRSHRAQSESLAESFARSAHTQRQTISKYNAITQFTNVNNDDILLRRNRRNFRE